MGVGLFIYDFFRHAPRFEVTSIAEPVPPAFPREAATSA
jgi:hypothetical protein